MNTKEILTIVALVALGLCLLCSLAKAAMKGDKGKKHCDKVCGAFVFLAIVLMAVSQLLGEGKEKYEDKDIVYCDGYDSAEKCGEYKSAEDCLNEKLMYPFQPCVGNSGTAGKNIKCQMCPGTFQTMQCKGCPPRV